MKIHKTSLIAIAILTLIIIFLSFNFFLTKSPSTKLKTITKDIPKDWWEGGWDKQSELEDFIESHPGDPILCSQAQYYVAGLYYAKGEHKKAIEEYQKVITDYPCVWRECSKAQFEIGQIYFYYLKDIPQALVEYKKVIDNYPYYPKNSIIPNAQFMMGFCYKQLKEYDKALIEFEKVAGYPYAHFYEAWADLEIGNVLMEQTRSKKPSPDTKQIERALSYYKQAYLICPIEKTELMQWIINAIHKAFKTLDGNLIRANDFIKYQKYGTAGPDKRKGTEDDLVDPLGTF